MKKDWSFEFIMIFVIMMVSIILFGIYLIVDLIVGEKEYLLVLNPLYILNCEKWECNNVTNKLDVLNNKKFNIYFDNNNMGVNTLYFNNVRKKFYIFDDKDNNILNDERFFAYSGAKIVGKYFNEDSISKSEYNKLKKEVDLDYSLDDIKKISFDFDNDEENEKLFTINYPTNSEYYGISLFNALVYENDGKYYVLDKRVTEKNDAGYVYVSNVLDIFDDGKVEFIYTTEYFDNIGYCSIIYRLKGKKFVKVNDCEVVKR